MIEENKQNHAKISFPLGRTKQIHKPWDIIDTNKGRSSSISTGWESMEYKLDDL